MTIENSVAEACVVTFDARRDNGVEVVEEAVFALLEEYKGAIVGYVHNIRCLRGKFPPPGPTAVGEPSQLYVIIPSERNR